MTAGIICGPLPAITNEDFNSTNREYFKYETVVTYHCNLGERRQKLFDLMGEPSIYCSSEDNQVGIWSRPPCQYIISNKCTPLVIENVINMSENKSFFFFPYMKPCLKLSVSKYFLLLLMLQKLPLLLEVCQPPPEMLHGKHTPNHKDDCSPGQEVFYSPAMISEGLLLCAAHPRETGARQTRNVPILSGLQTNLFVP
ncbi:hypothetical protein Celaphus_00010779, partial [Cervus elaphus hippelaphus]